MTSHRPLDLHDETDWHESPTRADRWGCLVGLSICVVVGFSAWWGLWQALWLIAGWL